MRANFPGMVLVLAGVLSASAASAQIWGDEEAGYLQASNLMEYQVGRDPSSEEEESTRLVDQFILDYTRGALRLGLRYEFFRRSPDDAGAPASYDELTQKYAEWSRPELTVRVGNSYAILGRGLLFRAFELPGVIRDTSFPKARYAESRDLDGVVITGRAGPAELKLLSGRPVASPELPYSDLDYIQRRAGDLSAARIRLEPVGGLRFGASYVRSEVFEFEEQGGLDLELQVDRLVPALADAGVGFRAYAEYAGRQWQPFVDGFTTDDGTPHALYSAFELSYGTWGASFETKLYHQFALRVNDPPSLVPEFGDRLLNRATHVLDPNDETGNQVSVQGALPRGWTTRFDYSDAVGRRDVLGSWEDPQRYDLWFLGLETPIGGPWHAAFIGATGQDEVDDITDRWLVGAEVTRHLSDIYSLKADVEYMPEERRTQAEPQHFESLWTALVLSRAGLGSVAVQAEFSNDPAELDDPFTPEEETDPRSWWGGAVNWQFDENHEVTLFVGERRGGTACTSGTCYEVPEFSGVELRLTSRF